MTNSRLQAVSAKLWGQQITLCFVKGLPPSQNKGKDALKSTLPRETAAEGLVLNRRHETPTHKTAAALLDCAFNKSFCLPALSFSLIISCIF